MVSEPQFLSSLVGGDLPKTKSTWVQGSQTDQVWSLALVNVEAEGEKERERERERQRERDREREIGGSGKTRQGFISVGPSCGRQWTSVLKPVSRVLKILVRLCKKTVGPRSVGPCSWAVEVRLVIVLGSITQGLDGMKTVVIARGGSFGSHHGMLCPPGLLPELKDKLGCNQFKSID